MAAHSSCIARAKLTFPILIVTEEKTTPWPKFDKAVSELHDWLSLVEDVIKSQRIMLGDVDEMQRLTNKQKQVSFLQLISGRKPQFQSSLLIVLITFLNLGYWTWHMGSKL